MDRRLAVAFWLTLGCAHGCGEVKPGQDAGDTVDARIANSGDAGGSGDGGGSGAANGAPCEQSSQCAGGFCAEEGLGFPGGYCTQTCSADADCTEGGHCETTYSSCVRSCSAPAECRVGYTCADYMLADMRTECIPGCTDNASCSDPEAARCDSGSGSCQACVANSDCDHLGLAYCAMNGQCVECVGDSDCSRAEGYVCEAGACTSPT